jgi:hypothetical protein
MAEKKKLTPKEAKIVSKRSSTFDSNTKGLPLPKKSDPKTIKAAAAKGSGKPKYKGVNTKQNEKIMKGETRLGKPTGKLKKVFQESTREMVKDEKVFKKTNTAKPTTPKVPVKSRGGMRGGGSLGGGGGLNKANR